MPRDDERAEGCFLAGEETCDLYRTLQGAHSWVEYRDAKLLRDSFFHVSRHAGTLSTVLKGAARGAAAELAKHAKDLEKALGRKRVLGKAESAKYDGEIFGMRRRAEWIERAAKAQCGDRISRQALESSKMPPLAGKKKG